MRASEVLRFLQRPCCGQSFAGVAGMVK
jgi:hypothetical protein